MVVRTGPVQNHGLAARPVDLHQLHASRDTSRDIRHRSRRAEGEAGVLEHDAHGVVDRGFSVQLAVEQAGPGVEHVLRRCVRTVHLDPPRA